MVLNGSNSKLVDTLKTLLENQLPEICGLLRMVLLLLSLYNECSSNDVVS